MKKHRKLRYGEIIRFGDEYLHAHTGKWCVEKKTDMLVLAGKKYNPGILNSYRRPMPAKSARTVRRLKRPPNKLRAAIARYPFYFEKRGPYYVRVDKAGGVAPATFAEKLMWCTLQRAAI